MHELLALAFSLVFALSVTWPAAAGGVLAPEEEPARARLPATGGAAQTIGVRPLPSTTYLDPDFDIVATATSGLPVSFSASGDCAVTGSTVRLLSAGRCLVTASQPGDSRYQPAPEVKIPLAIGKAEQRISLPLPPAVTFLDPDFELEATSSSGLPLVLVGSDDCEITGSTVRILGAGTCSVSARQPGDRNFTAARIVEGRFPIARADQTVDLRLSGIFYRGTSVPLAASATSRLPVRFDAYGSCAVVGSTLNLVAEGLCAVSADQPGGRNFNPAPTVTKNVTVLRVQ